MRSNRGSMARRVIPLLAALVPLVLGAVPLATASPALGGKLEPVTSSMIQEPGEHAEQEPEAASQEGESHVEEGHGEEEEHAEEPKEWWYWPSKWINFIALSALLYWMLVVPPRAIQDIFSFPGLRVIFAERAAAIIAARDLAAEQKRDAEQMLADSEQRLDKIDQETAALVAEARTDAEREKERAAEDGKAQAEKVHTVAEREIKHARITAQRQLRGFVADLAVNMAEANLEKHLTADDQDRLIREYLSRLGQSMA